MSKRRTYWHLEEARRKPSEYEVATSRLLYSVPRGLAVDIPAARWNARYQQGSPLACDAWDSFVDPRETTYAKYTELQSAKQIYVEGLLRSIDDAFERSLSPSWIAVLDRAFAPLRYPVHGLQMVAAYVAQMAPAGRIVVASAMQSADEMRRIQLVAYRMRQLQKRHAGFGDASRERWEKDRAWQPLREVIEKLLVAYDWGEAFVALNLVVKPAIDELFVKRLGALALSRGDDVLFRLLASLDEDTAWHRAWSRALAAVAVSARPENAGVIEGFTGAWTPRVARAIDEAGAMLDEGG